MSKDLKVLVSSNDYPEAGLEILRQHFTVLQSRYTHFGAEGITENKEELLRLSPGISGLVWVSHHPITKELLDKAGPSLKVVATASAGYNHCNVDELKARGIKLSNTPDVLSPAVAEIAIALMLGSGRRFTENLEQVHRKQCIPSVYMQQGTSKVFVKINSKVSTTKKSRPKTPSNVQIPSDGEVIRKDGNSEELLLTLNADQAQVNRQSETPSNVEIPSDGDVICKDGDSEEVLFTLNADQVQVHRQSSPGIDTQTVIALAEEVDINHVFVRDVAAIKPATDSHSVASNVSGRSSTACVSYTVSQALIQLMDNQEKMMTQLAILQTSVEYLMGKKLNQPKDDRLLNRLPIQPVNTKKDLDELEQKLKDTIFYKNIVSEMTFICGSPGKCRGTDSCYKLVDYFFTREILVNCNWTGSTRDINADKKIPLKFYSMIRNCFLDIIRKSDTNFTENDADKFFKVVIKNAKQRLNNKIGSVARTSKPRQKKVLQKPVSDDALDTISEEQELKESEQSN